MTERGGNTPESTSDSLANEVGRGLSRTALETLYIWGDPRGIAALPENAEYDVRELPEIDNPQT